MLVLAGDVSNVAGGRRNFFDEAFDALAAEELRSFGLPFARPAFVSRRPEELIAFAAPDVETPSTREPLIREPSPLPNRSVSAAF